MSQSTETTRPDPLIDAYRQASERDGARAGANVRAAVLAHARVVAQSAAGAVAANGVAASTRTTPAANESKPMWRLAAGVLIGLVGVWIFQLTRPTAAPDTAVAASASASVRSTAPTVAVPPTAPAPLASLPAPAATVVPEATVAAATPITKKDNAVSTTRAARTTLPEAARPEQNLAVAKAPLPTENLDRPAVFSMAAAPVLPSAAVASAADASAATLSDEVVIASAEMRKSAREGARAEPATGSAGMNATPRATAPNAFPAAVAGAAGAPLAPQTSTQMSEKARTVPISELDLTLFRAVRAGDMVGLRVAISRGANVNSKDEVGRSPLQIARERADSETIKVLETAGARP